MDVKKYGGYKGLTPGYFSLIESLDKKGNKIRTIESVPLYKINEFEKDINKFEEYCSEVYNLKEPRVIIPLIKKDAVLVVNKFPMYMRGSTGKQLILMCGVQLCLTEENERYLKKIDKYIERNKVRENKKELLRITDKEDISFEKNLELYNLLLSKQKDTIYKYRPGSQVEKLEDGREKFKTLSLENQCIVINEILNLLRCKPLTADLSLIEGAKLAGSIKINKIISKNKSVKMINKSITGLFKQEIDLLKI